MRETSQNKQIDRVCWWWMKKIIAVDQIKRVCVLVYLAVVGSIGCMYHVPTFDYSGNEP